MVLLKLAKWNIHIRTQKTLSLEALTVYVAQNSNSQWLTDNKKWFDKVTNKLLTSMEFGWNSSPWLYTGIVYTNTNHDETWQKWCVDMSTQISKVKCQEQPSPAIVNLKNY